MTTVTTPRDFEARQRLAEAAVLAPSTDPDLAWEALDALDEVSGEEAECLTDLLTRGTKARVIVDAVWNRFRALPDREDR